MYLAGDIGGTKTHLALYEEEKEVPSLEKKFPSGDYEDLKTIVLEFLEGKVPAKACFGIAGPVKNNVCVATNLPWVVDGAKIQKATGIEKVVLLNDLESNAYGLKTLKEEEFEVLNQGSKDASGNQALISAGTGLGEAGLYFDGKMHIPFACEGGHADFAPRNELEDDFLKYLREKFGHASYERVLSGPGLFNVYNFLVETGLEKETKEFREKLTPKKGPQVISEAGVKKENRACVRALELFVSLYGAECGNTALKMMATGGIYIGGGIAPKIISVMKESLFLEAFLDKGRFSEFLSSIPIKVAMNDNTALLGAKDYAKNYM